MKPVLVLYATREGQTRSIAEYLAAIIRTRGFAASLVNAAELPDEFRLEDYALAVLAASVHMQRHESEIIDFVMSHRAALEAMPTAFLSVSLSEAGAEDDEASRENRVKAADDVRAMIHDFLNETGWHPSKIKAVAGALMYTKYNFLVRLVMKRIARAAGESTDVSHDHVFTDWAALDIFVDELTAFLGGDLDADERVGT
jgi:menaquinone-dependent protoporphyrinogen oxidase